MLSGTTALIGAVLLTGVAVAQTAGPKAPFKAILDGDVNANFAVQSATQNTAHARQLGMENNAWMRFFFEGKADNGLTYGWYVRIMGASSSIAADGFSNDREAMYFHSPSWGFVEIGNGGATGKHGVPFVHADWGPPSTNENYLGPDGKLENVFVTDPRASRIFKAMLKLGSDDFAPSGRAEHIWWGSPTWNGVSFGADYAPDGTARNEEQFVTSTQGTALTQSTGSLTQYQNVWSANVNYVTTFGPVAFATGLQYAHAQSKNIFTATGSTAANRAVNTGHTGFKMNYAGIQFAVDYTFAGKSEQPLNGNLNSRQNMWGWGTGLEYFTGPWVIGAYYQFASAPGVFNAGTVDGVPNVANGVWEMNNYGVGAGYTLAPGLKLYTEFYYYDHYNTHVTVAQNAVSTGNPRNPHGQVFIFGTSFDW